MKVCDAISLRVSKIVQKKQFVKDILQSIESRSGRALLVGGAVRDLFLDLPVQDLDFEVYGLSLDQLQSILEQYGVVSLIGKSFGVLRVHGLDVDWSLPRKDSSGRHPVVQYDPFMPYEQAFIRRDLTINAMGIDMHTLQLIDPFGGLQDIEHKFLRAPDPHFFVQDPLRLLRVMQFCARFTMQVDEQLSQLCKTMDLSAVSCERIEQEFTKLFLKSMQPSMGLRWLHYIGKFHEFLPQVVADEELYQLIDHAAVQEYKTDQEKLAVMWAGIASCRPVTYNYEFKHLATKDQQQVIDFMRPISRHDLLIKQVGILVTYCLMLCADLTDAQLKWLAHWIAPTVSLRLLLQFFALRYDAAQAELLQQRAIKLGIFEDPEQPVLTGKDFMDVAQGVELGRLVKKAYQLQLDQGIVDKNQLKQMVIND